ncbi:MAG: hypothetical protein M0Z53_14300 [Thermaerobacter sp.]|nr:hypothetical protein [Thermaerobacter sp.]
MKLLHLRLARIPFGRDHRETVVKLLGIRRHALDSGFWLLAETTGRVTSASRMILHASGLHQKFLRVQF